MRISVIFPARKRPQITVRAIRSLLNNSSKDNDIEILLRFDDDDLNSVAIVKESVKLELTDLLLDANRKVEYFIGPRYGWPEIYRYYNELATNANGDWLMLFNDDAIMVTKDWDKEIEKYDGQMVIWSTWFPIIPKKVFDIWGHFSLTRQTDTDITEITGKLKDMGCDVRINLPIHILHDASQHLPIDDATFKERDYQSDFYNLKYELSRRRDAKLLKDYIDTGEIKRDKILDDMISGYGDIGTGDVNGICNIDNSTTGDTINKLIEDFEKKKSDNALYHHDDQINLQKREYELLTKIKPDNMIYHLFKLMCHVIPFKNSVPHIFTLMNLARYSKIGILDIGTCQGECAIALGIGAKVYGMHNPKITTVDVTQPDSQAIGYFKLFKEFLPSDSNIVVSPISSFSFNEPIDLLCISGDTKPEDLYGICNKYIPLVVKEGICIFFNTGIRETTNTILKYLNDSNTKYRILSPDLIDNDSRFLYNCVGIGVIRIV